MRVGHHLRLDMAGLVEELLHKAFAAAKGRHGLAHGRGIQLGHLVHAPGDLHAAATAAKGSLDDDGQAMLLGKGQHFVGILDGVGRAGHQRCADLSAILRASTLSPSLAMVSGRGPIQIRPASSTAAQRLRSRTESRSRGGRRRRRTSWRSQSAWRCSDRCRRLVAIQAIGFVGHARMQGVDIGIGIDGHGFTP
jgi:hypothetical protein